MTNFIRTSSSTSSAILLGGCSTIVDSTFPAQLANSMAGRVMLEDRVATGFGDSLAVGLEGADT